MALPVIQIVISIGIGLLGFLFLKKAITYETPETSCRQPLSITTNNWESEQRRPLAPQRKDGETSKKNNSGKAKYKAKPGETCVICLLEMSMENMQELTCGHALHKSCYGDCMKRNLKNCPNCRKIMSPIFSCVICLLEMSMENMQELTCGHALHKSCYGDCMKRNLKNCPNCRKIMSPITK